MGVSKTSFTWKPAIYAWCGGRRMRVSEISLFKVSFAWKPGNKPWIEGNTIVAVSGVIRISVALSPKSVRKILAHPGGGKIEGRLARIGSDLVMENPGVQLFDLAPASEPKGADVSIGIGAPTPTAPTPTDAPSAAQVAGSAVIRKAGR